MLDDKMLTYKQPIKIIGPKLSQNRTPLKNDLISTHYYTCLIYIIIYIKKGIYVYGHYCYVWLKSE
jgi:hypothetical protein